MFILSYIAKTHANSIDLKNCIQTSSCSQIPPCHEFTILLVVTNSFLLLGQKDTVLKHSLPLREGQLKEWFLNFFSELLQASPFSRNSSSSAIQVRNGLLIWEETSVPNYAKSTISRPSFRTIKRSFPLTDVRIPSYIKHIPKDTQNTPNTHIVEEKIKLRSGKLHFCIYIMYARYKPRQHALLHMPV